VTSIERTAYPRFRHDPNARELQELFTPAQDEVGFVQSLIRENNQHLFAAMLLLKCLQYLGYFPDLAEDPGHDCESCPGLPAAVAGRNCQRTTRSVRCVDTRLPSANTCN
jgi:hypothetical protein